MYLGSAIVRNLMPAEAQHVRGIVTERCMETILYLIGSLLGVGVSAPIGLYAAHLHPQTVLWGCVAMAGFVVAMLTIRWLAIPYRGRAQMNHARVYRYRGRYSERGSGGGALAEHYIDEIPVRFMHDRQTWDLDIDQEYTFEIANLEPPLVLKVWDEHDRYYPR